MATITLNDILHWPKPNLVNPETRVDMMLGVEISTTAAMALVMVGRFYTRLRLVKVLGKEDWIMLAAAVFSIANTVMTLVATRYGTGYHIWDVYPREGWIPVSGGVAVADQVLFAPTVTLVKISILYTYLRIFTQRPNRIFCYSMITFLLLWCTTTVFLMVFQCVPVESFWNVFDAKRRCINQEAALVTTGVINSVTDILVFLWPVPILWNIKISVSQRLSLLVVFTLGLVVCVAATFRIWYLTVYFHSVDETYTGCVTYVIQSVETNIGIICGSLPHIKPLLATFIPRIFGTDRASSPSNNKKSSNPSDNSHELQEKESFPFKSFDMEDPKRRGISVTQEQEWQTRVGHAPIERKVVIEGGHRYVRKSKPVVRDTASEEWILESAGRSGRSR